MSQAPARSAPTCPNCHAAVPRGARACSVCKLEVAKMAGYAAAKKAAQQRGIKTTSVETKAPPLVDKGTVVKAVLLLLLIGGLGYGAYAIFKPKPPRYLQFPATAQETARAFLTHISAGTDKEYDKAYGLISDAARNPNADDDIGDYRQIHHIMNLYLSREFGDNWITQTQLAPDPANPNMVVAHIALLETVHIQVQDDTPADKKALGPHYGVLGVAEFDVAEAKNFKQRTALNGVIRGEAGQGAVDNLASALSYGGAPRHETAMQKKVRLLPVVENPHEVNGYAVFGLWPIRQDPVVRDRLTQITNDPRFDIDIQRKADAVLKDKVTEEELIAAHVAD